MRTLKPALATEAVVGARHAGRGSQAGAHGALEARTPDRFQFLSGGESGDSLQRDPPPIGSTLAGRCRGVASAGLPRFSKCLCMHAARCSVARRG